MSKPLAIPIKHHRSVLHWWLNGISIRNIANRLRDRGVSLGSHNTVWNLIQRIIEGRSKVAGAATVARIRMQSGKAFEEMQRVQRRVLAATREDSTEEEIAKVTRQLPALREAHKMVALQLKMTGVDRGTYDDTLNLFSTASARYADMENAKDGLSWPFCEEYDDEEGEMRTSNMDARNPFGDSEFDLDTRPVVKDRLAEFDRQAANAEASADEAASTATPPGPQTPGRNELCVCGSGKKFKRCCIDKPQALPQLPQVDKAA